MREQWESVFKYSMQRVIRSVIYLQTLMPTFWLCTIKCYQATTARFQWLQWNQNMLWFPGLSESWSLNFFNIKVMLKSQFDRHTNLSSWKESFDKQLKLRQMCYPSKSQELSYCNCLSAVVLTVVIPAMAVFTCIFKLWFDHNLPFYSKSGNHYADIKSSSHRVIAYDQISYLGWHVNADTV